MSLSVRKREGRNQFRISTIWKDEQVMVAAKNNADLGVFFFFFFCNSSMPWNIKKYPWTGLIVIYNSSNPLFSHKLFRSLSNQGTVL